MTFKRKLNEQYVLADYQKWKGRWVHFTNTPYLKVNPDSFHLDPAGIYLFPESFETKGSWHKRQYKFIVEVPDDLKVLDLSHIRTPADALSLLDKLKVTDGAEYPDFKKQIEDQKRSVADIAWEYLQRYFGAATGQKKPGAFNKRLRDAGYEAVFDDAESIHYNEIQLIILDPKRFKIIERVEEKGSGYNYVKAIFDFIKAEGKKYGVVEAGSPKKHWEGYNKENQISTTLVVSNGKDFADPDRRYIYFNITASPDLSSSGRRFKDLQELMKTNAPVSTLAVSTSYSNPKLEGTGKSIHYRKDIRDVKMDEIQKLITDVLEFIFAKAT